MQIEGPPAFSTGAGSEFKALTLGQSMEAFKGVVRTGVGEGAGQGTACGGEGRHISWEDMCAELVSDGIAGR